MEFVEKEDGEKVEDNRTVSIILTYGLDTDKLKIDSQFENPKYDFKDPIGYTTHLLQLALEKWIIERVGMVCPSCSVEMNEDWDWCPKCGYSLVDEQEIGSNE